MIRRVGRGGCPVLRRAGGALAGGRARGARVRVGHLLLERLAGRGPNLGAVRQSPALTLTIDQRLGLKLGFTDRDVRHGYREEMLTAHPDRNKVEPHTPRTVR